MSHEHPPKTESPAEYTERWNKALDELDTHLEPILSTADKDKLKEALKRNLPKKDDSNLTPEEVKKFLGSLKESISNKDLLTISEEEREKILESVNKLIDEQKSEEEGDHGHGEEVKKSWWRRAGQGTATAAVSGGGLFTGILSIWANSLWNTLRGKEGGGGGGHGGGGGKSHGGGHH